VLSEKPFAVDAGEAREVAEAARRHGVRVAEAFHDLHHPVTTRLHALLASGEPGELRSAEADLAIPAPPDGDPRWSVALAGGALMDIGCYGLHALRHLGPWASGAPALESASGRPRAGRGGVDEAMTAHLRFPAGATGVVRCDMATALDFVRPDRDDRIRVEHLGRRPSYSYQPEAFAAHVREDAPLRTGPADAVATMVLIDEVHRAAGSPPRQRTTAATG